LSLPHPLFLTAIDIPDRLCHDGFRKQEEDAMELRLIRPHPGMESEVVRFNQEWMETGEEIVPSSVNLKGQNFEEWLLETYLMEKVAPKGYVTAHTYLFVDKEDRMLGAINIRHSLNGYLFNYGGHIGYGIRPSERMKGYGDKMLAMGLPLAKELGLEKVLITCRKENDASRRTLQRNGGILENEVIKDGRTIERYWITL